MMEQALAVMAGQVAAHHDFPAQVAQEIRQALRRPKARTVAEALIPAHTPEQVAVEAVRQVRRVVLDQGQTPARAAREQHQALPDHLLLTLVAVAVELLRVEQVQLVAREAAALEGIAAT